MKLVLLAMLLLVRVSGQDWLPRRIVALAYPKGAAASRVEGELAVRLHFGGERVERVEVLRGNGEFTESVVRNALRWEFRPLTPDRRASYDLTYSFELAPCRPREVCGKSRWRFELPDRVTVTFMEAPEAFVEQGRDEAGAGEAPVTVAGP